MALHGFASHPGDAGLRRAMQSHARRFLAPDRRRAGTLWTVGLFPEWTWVVGLLIGAAIGSFLNVVIYRMPRGLPLGDPPHSFCPACRSRLGLADLVPLLSWLVLRGRCRHCRAPVPPRYLMVELITGGIWAWLWHAHLVAGWSPLYGLLAAAFASVLVAAIFIDLRHYIIPDQINAALLFIGLLANGALYLEGSPQASISGVPASLVGALVGVGALWFVALLGRLLLGRDAMGHGDIKMARGIGAMLLPAGALLSFGLAVVLGAVLGLAQVLLRRRPAAAPESEGAAEDPPPESIGSLLKCGLGYALCIDVAGLLAPRLYERWFGENPYAVEEEEVADAGATMIPFGPYLAAGALALLLAPGLITGPVEAYWRWATGGL
jgi:leader peptidase (prepilin peptidase)/N-methyltransferase